MRHVVLLFIGSLAVGCGPSEEEPNSGDGALSPDTHECEPYDVGDTTDVLSGSWAMPNDEPSDGFVVPDDPGGGYVELELTASHPDVVPGFIVTADGDDSGAIISGTAAGTKDPTTMRGLFSVAPGQRYNVTFTQFQNAPADAYPVDFELSWSFMGTMDCYEPNDTADTARQVPVGTQIEAFAMAGYQSNGLTAPEYDDWYKVVVNRPATVEAELVTPPGDHRMRIRFWEADGTTQLANAGGDAGGETFTATQELSAAGTYLMSVEVADGARSAVSGDALDETCEADQDCFPLHYTAPYTVDLREVK